MAKIDEIKEVLTTMRVFFTVIVAIMIAIGGGMIHSFREQIYDIIFWLGLVSEILLMLSIFTIIKKIKQKTREIGDL